MVYKKSRRPEAESIDDEQAKDVGQIQDFAYQTNPSKSTNKIIATVVLVVLVLIGGWYLLGRYTNLNLPGVAGDRTASSWQAIFLANGQVYFGKVSKITRADLILNDIYYLQVVDQPLQRTQEGETEVGGQVQQELTLIKLGNELHGPTDQMIINRDHILLTEKLRRDSRVVQAIEDYLTQQRSQ